MIGGSLFWPSPFSRSNAMANERFWPSAKNEPMPLKFGRDCTATLIGFLPDWSTSFTPGVPVYLQTKTHFDSGSVGDGLGFGCEFA